jgi:hypothetical protein
MSTDEFRELWKRFRANTGEDETYTEEDILQILKTRAELSLKRLNRSIYFETVMSLLALLIILLFLAQLQTYFLFQFFQILVIVLITLYFVLIGWIYVKLNSIASLAGDLRHTLEKKVSLLTRFIKSYFWMNMLIAPVIFPLAIYAGYFSGRNQDIELIEETALTGTEYLLIAAASVVLVGAFYPFLRWYINKLYGKHVQELKKCLENLSDANGS